MHSTHGTDEFLLPLPRSCPYPALALPEIWFILHFEKHWWLEEAAAAGVTPAEHPVCPRMLQDPSQPRGFLTLPGAGSKPLDSRIFLSNSRTGIFTLTPM